MAENTNIEELRAPLLAALGAADLALATVNELLSGLRERADALEFLGRRHLAVALDQQGLDLRVRVVRCSALLGGAYHTLARAVERAEAGRGRSFAGAMGRKAPAHRAGVRAVAHGICQSEFEPRLQFAPE